MITIQRPASETEAAVQLVEVPVQAPAAAPRRLPARSARIRKGLTRLGSRTSALGLVATLLITMGGSGGVLNSGIPLSLQARAVALHQQWEKMRIDGIPALELATLEQEW